MSSSSSLNSTASSVTTTATPGVLWVTVNIQNKIPPLTPAVVEEWYAEHVDVVLKCPGNGGLFLRYIQTDKSISAYDDPDFGSRMTAPETTKDAVSKTGWVYLALVKLADIHWLASEQFNDMPRTSEFLPKEEDGSIGNAFSCWHAGLRGYETVAKGQGSSAATGRAKWLLSLQMEDGSKEELQKVGDKYGSADSCRSWIAYALRDGLLPYPEPGYMPRGMVLVEMDEKPEPELEKDVVRRDVWKLTEEHGDLSLSL